MRLASLVMAFAVMVIIGMPTAEARRYGAGEEGTNYTRSVRKHHVKHYAKSRRRHARSGRHYRSRSAYHGRRHYARRGAGGRPSKWCGWWMRTQLGGGPEYNRAAHWRNYGRPTAPRVGAVVVWPHHVGIITGRSANGRWIVKSGNDGGRVRERARSVAGAVFRIA